MEDEQIKIQLDLTPNDAEQILRQLQIAANETGDISTADWFVDECSKRGMMFYRDSNGTMRAELSPAWEWQRKMSRLDIGYTLEKKGND